MIQWMQLLAMVPQPVLAVLLLYPITKESDEANKKGGWVMCQQHPSPHAFAAELLQNTASGARLLAWCHLN
jgi:hypothetical protein